MDLAQLIHDRRGARTYRDLEDACHGQLSHQRWQQLATRHLRAFPAAGTIVAVATGLGVSERAVLLSAGESLGLKTSAKPHLYDLIPSAVDNLPHAAILAIVASINAMLAIYEGTIS
ncbi:hypothetical protein [Nocardia fluminea]|uniref:hypothetical protein n=1 Tax=Nocardia fluminea TaxID=134984 RepID=UPI0036491EFC